MNNSRYTGRRVRRNLDNTLNHLIFIEDTENLMEAETQQEESCDEEEEWPSPTKSSPS